jgi:methionyl-tRNA formyltransferase
VKSHIIATSRKWYEPLATLLEEKTGDRFVLVTSPQQLTVELLEQVQPKFVFFPHWSSIIPEEIHSAYTCVIFHMTDLPFGRGGSPLQNLISRGIKNTKMSAIRCIAQLDAGPIYLKKDLSLEGSAAEIFARCVPLISEMILEIVTKNPNPVPQAGEPVIFRRRKPSESNIQGIDTLEQLYDHIRMLDAPGYPHAFLETENFRIEITQAQTVENALEAKVRILPKSVTLNSKGD